MPSSSPALSINFFLSYLFKNSSTAAFKTAFGVVPASAHAALNFSA
nr:MAG TPA: hypothetical protein [Caudoviricetes sp.]